MEEIYLKQLRKRLPKNPHLEKDFTYEEWKNAGEPHLWLYKVSFNNAVGMLDMGHGYAALFEDGELTNLNNSSITIGKRYILLSEDGLKLFKEVDCKEMIE